MIKPVTKEMPGAKFYAILLILVMLAGILSLPSAISTLMDYVIVTSTGRIATVMEAPIAYKSEIRGVYIAANVLVSNHNWDLIADTLAGYNINTVIVDTFNTMGWINNIRDELPLLLNAFHSRGIKVIAIAAFPYYTQEHVWNEPRGQEEFMAWDYTLTPVTYACPIRIRDHIKSMAETLASYDIDGFMFDYIRYGNSYQWINGQRGATVYAAQIGYGPESKAKFEQWLGETITNWPGDFAPNGTRYNEFMEWRVEPITELVRDVRKWMLAINPDLEFSAAVWAATLPTGRRYWLGQDTANWVGKDYLDFVAPMLYVQATELPSLIQEAQTYFTGGQEGKIPMPIWITNGIYENNPISLEEFKQRVEYSRQYADGWIIWRYGGPGTDADWIDITPYLDMVKNETANGLRETFTLSDIRVNVVNDTAVEISWTTDLPATSKVEYGTSPLFNASYKYWSTTNFHYWDVDHIPGTIIEDNTPVTDHKVTLKGLLPGTKYYFRVQSQDISGIATSKVLTFRV
jgi:uncharacterized lipoprotein YddW (UPF0748 family)